jgi:LPS export ABC transporter protein LptC
MREGRNTVMECWSIGRKEKTEDRGRRTDSVVCLLSSVFCPLKTQYSNTPVLQTSMALILILASLFLSCTKLEEQKPQQGAEKKIPVLELKDSIKVDMYDGSVRAWILNTNYMKKLANTDILFARPIDMVMYDSSGKESAWVSADSGSADESVTFVSVWGHVRARSLEGVIVEADSLRWRKRTNKVSTDGWVKVVSQEGDTLTGVGFISDDRLENWKILSDVRSVIRKVDERVDESEEPSEKEK